MKRMQHGSLSQRPLVLLLLLAGACAMLVATGCTRAPRSAEAEVWTCPMHPTYVADHAGTCPICNMDLVKVEKAAEQGRAEAGAVAGATAATAAAMDCSEGSVKTHCSRATHALAAALRARGITL